MIHRYYAPVQLLALSPILYLTVQKGTPSSAGPLKVRGPIWSNWPKTGPDEGRGQAKLFLRTVTVSGAGMLRFSDIPMMCLKVCDDIDAVIWVKNAETILTLFLTLIA